MTQHNDSEIVEEKVAEYAKLVERAYNEGVSSGMDEYRTNRGGKIWKESKAHTALTEAQRLLIGEDNN